MILSDITEFAAGEHPQAYVPLTSIQPVRAELVEARIFSSRHYRICVKKIDCTSVKNLPRAGVELEDLAST